MPLKLKSLLLIVFALAVVLALASCRQKTEEAAPEGTALTPPPPQQAQMLESALKDDPNNLSILIQLGNLYYDMGQDEVNQKGEASEPGQKWATAIEYYRRALAVDPKNVNVRVDMATLMRYLNQNDEALAEYRKAISIDPKHPQARINLITAEGELKDYKSAIKEYEALLKAAPEQKDNQALKDAVDGFRKAMKEAKK